MEVHPSYNVHYAKESDFAQKCSAASYKGDGDSNCIDYGKVQNLDAKVDDLVLSAKTSHSEQGEDQWTVNETTMSNWHYNEDSYFEFEMDGKCSPVIPKVPVPHRISALEVAWLLRVVNYLWQAHC